jgi:hypothetical protein
MSFKKFLLDRSPQNPKCYFELLFSLTKRIYTGIKDIVRFSRFSRHSTRSASKKLSGRGMPRSDSVDSKLGHMLTSHPMKAQERAINRLSADLSKGINIFETATHLNDTGLFERVYVRGDRYLHKRIDFFAVPRANSNESL